MFTGCLPTESAQCRIVKIVRGGWRQHCFVASHLAACATTGNDPKANHSSPAASAVETGPWILLVPPLEGYSSDRTPQMGGPLALPSGWESRTGAGYRFVNVDRIDNNAPLDKWQKRHTVATENECHEYRAAKLKEFSNPSTTTKSALARRDRIIDPIFMKNLVEATRCVSADQLGTH